MQHANGTPRLALPEHEEAAAAHKNNVARANALAAGAFRAEVVRVAGQIASGFVARPTVSIEGITEREDLADDSLALAREIVVRSMTVKTPTDAELDALRPRS